MVYPSEIPLVSLLIGFYLGSKSERSGLPEETLAKVKRVFKKIELKREKVGAVEAPNAKMIERYDNPIKKAEEDEMAKTLVRLREKR